MITKVKETIKKYNMIEEDDLIIVALSGGPDSVALLHILYELKDKLKIRIVAAHVNHGLRGKDSDDDEKYVSEICSKYDIPLYSKRFDIHQIAKTKGLSCEMAGRESRYDYFSALMKKISANKIALAHHANDQAETILMRLIRGSGIEGLIGIKPVRDKIFIRPLISITRKKIENYCEDNKLLPRIDKTNYETIYSRNKVRLELIPYIEENFNGDITNTLNRFADIMKDDNDYLETIASQKMDGYCLENSNEIKISKEAFNEHRAILSRILRNTIKKIKGNLKNIEKKHIDDIIQIQQKETGKVLSLPDNVQIMNTYRDIIVRKKLEVKKSLDYKNLEYRLEINKRNFIQSECFTVKMKLIESKSGKKILKNNKFIKYFDYDKANNDIILRYRKNGDKFSPLGMKGRKKVKDYFMDLKIPQHERDRIPMICFGGNIAWIIGCGISNKYKIDNNTKRILQIIIEREEKECKMTSKKFS
ncbi:tRNA lysidine(34) synthetase TilS [Clostridium sediminicola]|uniref:tRNA lysidine(34) synthetase TilS n=1 Tax=Clostridium sediminicola TaxID=3114879 RepID=UPI0031F1FC7D